ncbi:MAG: hypothetical protein HFE46_06715 [Clostridia bacterium]|jgi:hypothetical protein|nr:hypothetical protein [Clostridia bacterium]
MADKGVCELCGFADDSYRIDENGTVMKVCKFCHDGYLERMGLSPDADKPVQDVALTIDVNALQADDIDFDSMTPEEVQALKDELAGRQNMRVPTLDEQQLGTLLSVTEDDKRVLTGVRQKERRRKKKETENADSALIAKIEQAEKKNERLQLQFSEEDVQAVADAISAKENDMSNKTSKPEKNTREEKEAIARERIHAAANQTIDDERIRITSPEVELRKDRRPKTNLDVAVSEYAGGVRFLDTFKYVLHRISYAVFLGLIVLAVSTVLFIRDGWQHGLIVLGGGLGAVLIGFLLVWYLSRCYELDRRALLLRIRQQEILFESMNSDCYRELRTKYTMIKALGWLLNKLSVLLPLAVLVGGNIAAVIAAFLRSYWLFPVLSGCATVAAVLVYYLVKFAADRIAYMLDRERNQQVQQQTLLDILDRLKK